MTRFTIFTLSVFAIVLSCMSFAAGRTAGKLEMYETTITVPPPGAELAVCMRGYELPK